MVVFDEENNHKKLSNVSMLHAPTILLMLNKFYLPNLNAIFMPSCS